MSTHIEELDEDSRKKLEPVGKNELTKRERFAMAAMQGIIARKEINPNWSGMAEIAVRQADALIEELRKEIQCPSK